MARTKIQPVRVLDFRVVDQVLAESDPDAANVIYAGLDGKLAYPFVVMRRVSGPSGWYVDTCRVQVVGKFTLAEWDRTFELEGESVDRWLIDTQRTFEFPGPGNYSVEYSVMDDVLLSVEFEVIASAPPYAGIMPGPVDAGLAKATIAWVTVPQADKAEAVTKPVWFGYENGIVFVLSGEGEQVVPNLTTTSNVLLSVRSKDKRSLVGEVDCAARVVPKGAEWDRIVRDQLIGRRLNLSDGDKAIDRWRKTCEVVALTPIPPELVIEQ